MVGGKKGGGKTSKYREYNYNLIENIQEGNIQVRNTENGLRMSPGTFA